MSSTGVGSTPTRWPASTPTIRRSTTTITSKSPCWLNMTYPFYTSSVRRILSYATRWLAKGYHIVLPLISGSGAVQKNWDEVYQRMVDNGFSTKVVMAGTGAKAGESYAWAIANSDKVSAIYARNPLMHSLMSKAQPLDSLAVLAKAGVPILHDCGSLGPWLKDNT